MTEDFDDEPTRSSIGDEVTRLFTVVQDWATQAFPPPDDDPLGGHTGSDCQWCPICQFMAVLRGERPDVTERVAEAGTALASAFRAFVDAAASSGGQPGAHRHGETEPPARPRVQRIDLGGEPSDSPDGG